MVDNHGQDHCWSVHVSRTRSWAWLVGLLLSTLLIFPVTAEDPDLTTPNNEVGDLARRVETALAAVGDRAVPPSYQREIRPILSDRCFRCHGPDAAARRAGLRLDRRDDAIRQRDGVAVIVPGDPLASELVSRIHDPDTDSAMPPEESGKALSDRERSLLVQWVAAGAPYETHWAWQAPEHPGYPSGAILDRDESIIDAWIREGLKGTGLKPAVRADRATEFRRLALDLTGLPPTIEELDQYLGDNSEEAYERAIESLLESDRSAEHFARHWLDAARYADTHGLHLDNERVMWPYRDWVIEAFRRNLPFDQFTIEQLAGDLIPSPTLSQRVASGFNRCHVTTSEGGAIDAEYLVKYAVDRVETLSTVWLGLTAGCAACHDHKFDPISQREFYSLYAFFNSTAEAAMDGNAKAPAPVVQVATTEQEEQLAQLNAKIADLEIRQNAPDAETDREQTHWEEKRRASSASAWVLLDLESGARLKSENGATLVSQPDGSFLTTEKDPEVDTLTLTAPIAGENWRSLRVEALTDPSLPQGGPGRAKNSNFVLTEVEAFVTDEGGQKYPIEWAGAWADHHQQGWEIGKAIDGNRDALNGWAGEGFSRQERRLAIFRSKEPFGVPGRGTLTVRFFYLSPYDSHVLGRTRYAISKESSPSISERVWIDDEEDLGAELKYDGAVTGWPFVNATEAPIHSGLLARKQSSDKLIQHYFHQAKKTRDVRPGDRLYAWIWIDPNDLPETVMLQVHDGTNWEHRAFWGADRIPFGGIGADTPAHRLMGELPASGEWVRLDVSCDQVGLPSGAALTGFAFTQFGGTVIWDDAGTIAADPMTVLDPIVLTPAEHRAPAQANQLRRRFRLEHSPRHAELLTELNVARREKAIVDGKIPTTLVSQELAEPRPAHLLDRGEYDRPKELVERDTPAFLPSFSGDLPRNRLGFARWLVTDDQPLTARVTVNRIWQHFFGTGIVRTSEDFGLQGEWPSHPELLDALSVELLRGGWDLRDLIRKIVRSDTYRQSSAITPLHLKVDPENRLLSRAPRYRLDAEVIRDQALYVSGLLVEQLGGPPVKPYQPPGIWQAVGYTDSNTQTFSPGTGKDLYRRSIYTFWKRTAPPPSMAIFDAPNRETCTVRRERTNSPLAALVLLNDVQFVEAARHFGGRLLQLDQSNRDRLITGFRAVTSRYPNEEELTELTAIFDSLSKSYSADPQAVLALLEVGESSRNESLDPAELAAWTVLSSLLLNLDEAITRG